MPGPCDSGSTVTSYRLIQGSGSLASKAAHRCPFIQQLLGHSSLATTATYVSHIAPAKAVAEATANTAHLAVAP